MYEYTMKYAHGLEPWRLHYRFLVDPCDLFEHILQGCFLGIA